MRRASYQYDPFGNITFMEGDMAESNPFRFSSEHHDEDLGLVYYNYRHYNPTDGRWISRDPIAEQGGWNLYAFVANRPISITDSFGLGFWDEFRDVAEVLISFDPAKVIGSCATARLADILNLVKDKPGKIILTHWLTGHGAPMNVSDSEWGNYMQNNRSLASTIWQFIITQHIRNNQHTSTLNFRGHIEMDDNGYSTGYELLHGTNRDVGDFTATGRVSVYNICGCRLYMFDNIEYVWNDKIDPNYSYGADMIKSAMIRAVAGPVNYNIRISWNATAAIMVCDHVWYMFQSHWKGTGYPIEAM